jgi:YbbR domain-containing protein
MNLITDDWKIKLLALGLAVLMLGAVAFSQNPPKQVVLRDVNIGYTIGPDIVVIDPPTKANVTVTGLADALTTVNSRNVAAAFDLTKVSPGQNVHVNLNVRSLLPGTVKVENPSVPYILNIDRLVTKEIPVQVRPPRISVGWSLTKIEAQCPPPTPTPCAITFTGPATWVDGLTAKVDYPNPVNTNGQAVPSIPVQLVQANGQLLDLSKQTQPLVRYEPSTVTVAYEAKPGTTLRQVVLIDALPTHGPAPGYRITNVTVDPVTVVISGPPEILARISTVTLPGVDLNGATSSKTFQVSISYPDSAIVGPQTARVTYTISPNPAASPGP